MKDYISIRFLYKKKKSISDFNWTKAVLALHKFQKVLFQNLNNSETINWFLIGTNPKALNMLNLFPMFTIRISTCLPIINFYKSGECFEKYF